MKLFKSTIVTRYSNMSQKDIQETISQLPAGSISLWCSSRHHIYRKLWMVGRIVIT